VDNVDNNNDARAHAVEKYILDNAVAAGVVKEITIRQPKNPNKWGKKLAPWFTEECREAKKTLAEAKRNHGKGDSYIIHATRMYHKVCLKARLAFA
jgi:hypothetical protein